MLYIFKLYILAVSETYLLCTFKLLSCATMLCACISNSSNFHHWHDSVPQAVSLSASVPVPKKKITQNGICLAYTRYIHSICQAYTLKSLCITFTDNYAVLTSSVKLHSSSSSSKFDCPQPWHGFTTLKLQEIHKTRILIYLAYT